MLQRVYFESRAAMAAAAVLLLVALPGCRCGPSPSQGPSKRLSRVHVAPFQVAADGLAQAVVTVFVASDEGTPLSGLAVALQVSGSANVLQPAQLATQTDANGKSVWRLVSTVAEVKSVQAFAGDVALGAVQVEFISGPAATLTFTVQPQDVVAGELMKPVVVAALDALGNPVRTAQGPRVAVRLGGGPQGAELLGVIDVDAVSGFAKFATLHLLEAGRPYVLHASAPGLRGASSLPFSVQPGSVKGQRFLPTAARPVAGDVVFPPLEVVLFDAFGNRHFSGGVPVTITAPGPQPGVLSGTLARATSLGLAQFDDLRFSRSGTYALRASSPGLDDAALELQVAAAPLAGVRFKFVPDAGQAGVALTPSVEVELFDTSGGPLEVQGPAVTLSVASAPPDASLPDAGVASADSGVASFSDVTLTRSGAYTLRAAIAGFPAVESAPVTIAAGPAASTVLSVTAPPLTAGVCGGPLASLSAVDVYGNPAPAPSGGQFFAIESTSVGATLYLDPACTTPSDGGLIMAGGATSASVWVTDTHAGYPLVWVTPDGGVDAGTFEKYTVRAGAPARLAFDVQPKTALRTQPIRPVPSVVVQDAYGNRVVGATPNITITHSGGTPGATLSGTTLAPALRGRAVFPNLALDTLGPGYRLEASSPGLTPAVSDAFEVVAGPGCTGKTVLSAVPAASSTAPPTALRAMDANGDGRLDLLYASFANIFTFAGAGDGTLAAAVPGATGLASAEVVTADFDNDGHADVLALAATIGLDFFKGHGDGTFSAPVRTPLVGTASLVAAADFDRDGKVDAVVAGAGGTSATVWKGVGDGTFASPVQSPIPLAASGLVVGDLNGDMVPDLMVEHRAARAVTALLGDGTGALTQSFSSSILPAGNDVMLADYTGDGVLDVASYGQGAVGPVIAVQPGRGDGTFGAAIQTSIEVAPVPTSEWTVARTGDFDGDGRLDIAGSHRDFGVTIAHGDGLGSFTAAPVRYDLGDGVTLLAGDFNGDGRDDLVGKKTGPYRDWSVIVGLGQADRSVLRPAIWKSIVSRELSDLACVDMNADGTLDLLAAGGRWGSELGWNAVLPDGGVSAPTVLLPANSSSVAVHDIDGDGLTDLAASDDGYRTYVAWGRPDAGPGPFLDVTNPPLPAQGVAIADANNDGRQDLVVAWSGVRMVTALGNRRWTVTDSVQFPTANDYRILNGDLNDDGDVDLVAVPDGHPPTLAASDGQGHLVPRPVTGIPDSGGAVLGDFNEDGYLDLLFATWRSELCFVPGRSSGSLGQAVCMPSAPGVYGMVSGDFDGDSHLDAVVMRPNYVAVQFLRGLGDGSFAPPVTFGMGLKPLAIASADLDGDGRLEVALLGNGWEVDGALAILRGVCLP